MGQPIAAAGCRRTFCSHSRTEQAVSSPTPITLYLLLIVLLFLPSLPPPGVAHCSLNVPSTCLRACVCVFSAHGACLTPPASAVREKQNQQPLPETFPMKKKKSGVFAAICLLKSTYSTGLIHSPRSRQVALNSTVCGTNLSVHHVSVRLLCVFFSF